MEVSVTITQQGSKTSIVTLGRHMGENEEIN